MIGKVVRIGGAIASLLIAASAHAAIYKWTDEQGKVQYSQTPPPGVNATAITPIPPPPNAGQPDAALQERLGDFGERRETRKQSEAELAERQEAEKIRAENCEQARDNLTALQTHGRVSIKEGDNYRALTEEERQAKIGETQSYIEDFCKEVASTE